MKACTVSRSGSGDPRTTSTTKIWQATTVERAISAKAARLSECFHLGLTGHQGSEEDGASIGFRAAGLVIDR